MDNNWNDIEKLKMEIAMFNATEDIKIKSNRYLQKNTKEKGVNLMKKKIIATACASLVLVSGIVIATNIKNIKKTNRGLGDGVEVAVENGYIANPRERNINPNATGISKQNEIKVDNMTVKIGIEDFLMDDVNLSTQILFEFDNKLKEVVDLDKVNAIELTDLIIRDEEKRIIYGGNDEEKFKKYCEENNLSYTFCEFNDNYMNCGVNCFNVLHDKETNSIKIMYNMYTSDTYPKSKKLYISFGKITMIENNQGTQNRVIINGNWQISVDVPKEMYNRSEEYYKVVSCDNNNFNIYTAKVTDTGFEIGVIISNIEEPEFDNDKFEEFITICDAYSNNKISKEEYDEKTKWYYEYEESMHPISIWDEEKENESYIENEDGEKYKSTLSPSRKAKTYFLEGNKYDFYDTFGMTKYDATDKVKVVLYYYGNPVTIELEKIR